MGEAFEVFLSDGLEHPSLPIGHLEQPERHRIVVVVVSMRLVVLGYADLAVEGTAVRTLDPLGELVIVRDAAREMQLQWPATRVADAEREPQTPERLFLHVLLRMTRLGPQQIQSGG